MENQENTPNDGAATKRLPPRWASPKAAPSFCYFATKLVTIRNYLPLTLPLFATKIATIQVFQKFYVVKIGSP